MSEQKSTSDATASLSPQMREFARVTTALANGDLTQKVPLERPMARLCRAKLSNGHSQLIPGSTR
jgi:hypothetical protein